MSTIQQKIADVRTVIAELAKVVPPDQITYSPAQFKGLTVVDFVELTKACPEIKPETYEGYSYYRACGRFDGVFVTAETAMGTRSPSGILVELEAIANTIAQ
jgi:hypothetical protein